MATKKKVPKKAPAKKKAIKGAKKLGGTKLMAETVHLY